MFYVLFCCVILERKFYLFKKCNDYFEFFVNGCIDMCVFFVCFWELNNVLMSGFLFVEDKDKEGKKEGEEKFRELKICVYCKKKIEGKFLLWVLD